MSNPKVKLENDYERMVPEYHKNSLTYAEHLTRYLSALDLVENKIVLDIACGSGYGSKLLSSKASHVYGVDIDKKTVEYAKQEFNSKNITYLVGNGENIPLNDDSVDVVVTFETIEHIDNYKKFLDEISRVLKSNGLAIVSTPNDIEFAEGNHFHLHQFKYKELEALLRKKFKYTESYFQGTWKYVAVGSRENLEGREINLKTLNLSPKTEDQYLYFYILCSNKKLEQKVQPIAAIGEHYSDRTVLAEKYINDTKINSLNGQVVNLSNFLNKANEQSLKMQKERDDLKFRLSEITSSRKYRLIEKVSKKRKLKSEKSNDA